MVVGCSLATTIGSWHPLHGEIAKGLSSGLFEAFIGENELVSTESGLVASSRESMLHFETSAPILFYGHDWWLHTGLATMPASSWSYVSCSPEKEGLVWESLPNVAVARQPLHALVFPLECMWNVSSIEAKRLHAASYHHWHQEYKIPDANRRDMRTSLIPLLAGTSFTRTS